MSNRHKLTESLPRMLNILEGCLNRPHSLDDVKGYLGEVSKNKCISTREYVLIYRLFKNSENSPGLTMVDYGEFQRLENTLKISSNLSEYARSPEEFYGRILNQLNSDAGAVTFGAEGARLCIRCKVVYMTVLDAMAFLTACSSDERLIRKHIKYLIQRLIQLDKENIHSKFKIITPLTLSILADIFGFRDVQRQFAI